MQIWKSIETLRNNKKKRKEETKKEIKHDNLVQEELNMITNKNKRKEWKPKANSEQRTQVASYK